MILSKICSNKLSDSHMGSFSYQSYPSSLQSKLDWSYSLDQIKTEQWEFRGFIFFIPSHGNPKIKKQRFWKRNIWLHLRDIKNSKTSEEAYDLSVTLPMLVIFLSSISLNIPSVF